MLTNYLIELSKKVFKEIDLRGLAKAATKVVKINLNFLRQTQINYREEETLLFYLYVLAAAAAIFFDNTVV